MTVLKFIFILLLICLIIYFCIELYSNKVIKDGKQLLNSIRKDFQIEDELLLNIPKYYINLDRSIDRREKLEEEFIKYGMKNYTRIKAIDKDDLTGLKNGEMDGVKYIIQYKMRPHEIAITLSHLIAIKRSYDNGDDQSIIFEDDINFSLYPLWKKSFTSMVKSLPKNAEIFQMASNRKIDNIGFNIIKRPNDLQTHGCSEAYLINRKGMKKIIDNFFIGNQYYIILRKKLNLVNPCFDFGIFNFMEVYYPECNLFLLYSFEKEKNTYQQNKILRFLERDYQTLQYLTGSI